MSLADAPFRLPATYLRALDAHANEEIPLDWRALGHRKAPRLWPGSIFMFRRSLLARENRTLGKRRLDGDPLFFIGTNTAGIVFALDRRGRVLVLDEITVDDDVVLAPTFAALLASTKRAQPKTLELPPRSKGAIALPKPPFALPATYDEMVRRWGNRTARGLGRAFAEKRPSPWSGHVHVFGPQELAELNAYFDRRLPRRRRGTLFFFGNDAAGLTLAVDLDGDVFTLDQEKVERPFVRFDALARAMGVGEQPTARKRSSSSRARRRS
ncbi:MAG TPA: hypothetical protein VLT33_33690 [Labilithrix sp.]|nr:hypothetical protein [Labilithrix sp.]